MFKKIVIALLFVIGTLISVPAEAGPQTIVVGQNSSAVDIQTVQAAVDQGGTVLLKGTFDFGDKGRVNITKDVKIAGETDDKGVLITKIKDGFWTFYSPLPAKLPPEVPGPKITIQNIHFEGALWTPIHLAYSSGATITRNKITNVRPMLSEEPIFGKTGLNRQDGILCTPAYVQPMDTRKYQPGAITSHLIIIDNEIDLFNEAPTKTMAHGIFVFWATGITAKISHNTIYNCTRDSIETIDNYLGKDGSGMLVIQDNKIVTSQVGLPVPTPFTPVGILAGWFTDMTGAVDPKRNIRHIIINNAIRIRGQVSVGISVHTDGAVVENNAVLSEKERGIPLFSSGSNGYIAHNRVEGTGVFALGAQSMGPMKPSNNVLVGNDFSLFKATGANVSFGKGATNNLVFGSSGSVTDLGEGNQITGLKPVTK